MNSSFRRKYYLYEIYPQSETPHLIQIARLDVGPQEHTVLLPGTVIWFGFYEDKTIFRVWDYRLNHSISFSVDVIKLFECVKVYFVISKAFKSVSNSSVGR